MIKLINEDRLNDLRKIKASILDCLYGDHALVIKDGLNIFSLADWEVFFKKDLQLLNDDRQFNLQNNLEKTTWWSIIYDENRDAVYTHSKTRQPLHNDNAWFSDPAELVVLAMERQAVKGGENTIYSVKNLISDLKRDNPTLLEVLKKTEVLIKKDASGKYFNKTTIIKGNQIFWNYYRTIKDDKFISNMCDLFFKYLEAKENTQSILTYKLSTNDILCFNDTKLLHGRLSFSASTLGDRITHQSMWRINSAAI